MGGISRADEVRYEARVRGIFSGERHCLGASDLDALVRDELGMTQVVSVYNTETLAVVRRRYDSHIADESCPDCQELYQATKSVLEAEGKAVSRVVGGF